MSLVGSLVAIACGLKESKMIESLTAEQTKQLAVYRDKWLKIGLSTERADFAKAEKVLAECYKVAGLTPPKK